MTASVKTPKVVATLYSANGKLSFKAKIALLRKSLRKQHIPVGSEEYGIVQEKIRKLKKAPRVAATYLPVGLITEGGTCPSTCPYLGSRECYALTQFLVRQQWKNNVYVDPLEEADAIARLKPSIGELLRIHVSGDFISNAHLMAVNKAVAVWTAKGGGKVWSYTHNWRNLNPALATNFTLLASVHTVAEVFQAYQLGYRHFAFANLHITKFLDKFAKRIAGLMFVPCPALDAEGEITCASCQLCPKGCNVRFYQHENTAN